MCGVFGCDDARSASRTMGGGLQSEASDQRKAGPARDRAAAVQSREQIQKLFFVSTPTLSGIQRGSSSISKDAQPTGQSTTWTVGAVINDGSDRGSVG